MSVYFVFLQISCLSDRWQLYLSLCRLLRAAGRMNSCCSWERGEGLPRYSSLVLLQHFEMELEDFPDRVEGSVSSSFPAGFLGIALNPTAHSKRVLCSVRSRQRWCSSPRLQPRQGWDLREKVFHVRFRAWGDLPASMLGESAAQLLLLVESQKKGDHCCSPAPWASSSF